MPQASHPPKTPPSAERDHDDWFRSEVQKTLDGLKDGSVKVVSEAEHDRRWVEKRAALAAKAQTRA